MQQIQTQRRIYFVLGERLIDNSDSWFRFNSCPFGSHDNVTLDMNKPLIQKNIKVEILDVNRRGDGTATISISGVTDKGVRIKPKTFDINMGQFVKIYVPELCLDVVCGIDNFEYVPSNRTPEEDRRLFRNAVDRVARITNLPLTPSDENQKGIE